MEITEMAVITMVAIINSGQISSIKVSGFVVYLMIVDNVTEKGIKM